MLPELQAEEQLMAIEAVSVPHMNPAGQRDVIRRQQQLLGREGRAKPATDADLAGLGISVKRVPKKAVKRG